MTNKLLPLILLALLGACSFTREVGDQWVLTLPDSGIEQPQASSASPKSREASLKIDLPESPSYLESQRVAVKRPDGALDYYSGMRWADMLPLYLQQAMVGSLRQRAIYTQVVSDEVATPSLYRLLVQINSFAVTHEHGQPEAQLKIVYTLQKNFKPLHSGTASGSAVLADESRAGIQQGFAVAYASLLDDLSRQLQQHK